MRTINEIEIKQLRSRIEANLNSLLSTAKAAKLEIKTSSEMAVNAFQNNFDSAQGEIDLKAAADLYQHTVVQQNQLKQALARLNSGTYGQCDECEEEIDSRRLEAMPGATHCVHCQRRREFVYNPEPAFHNSSNHIQIRWAA
jgi:DnaK suppressor protein